VSELGQIAVAFVAGIGVLAVWRYLQRALDWLEPRTAKGVSRFGVLAVRHVAPRWPELVFWVAVAAGAGVWSWLEDYRSGLVFFWSCAAGWVLRSAEDSARIPAGLGRLLFGLFILALGARLAVHFAFVDPPFIPVAVLAAALGIVEVGDGVRALQRRADTQRARP
jgi:hypothetical protein